MRETAAVDFESKPLTASRIAADTSDGGGALRVVLYMVLAVLSLVVVAVLRPGTDHGLVAELGRSFAMLGFAILTLQFVLSGRLKWVERPFGHDIVLHFHQTMALFAVVLLFAHPLLLAAGGEGWSLLTGPDRPWHIWTGRGALVVLVLQVVLTLSRKRVRLDYERWRFLHHSLAGLVLGLGFVHSWNAGEDLTLLAVQVLWVAAVGVAATLYFHHRLPRGVWTRDRMCRVTDVRRETHDVWTIRFTPLEQEESPFYLPGQFHFVTLYRGDGLSVERHPFTISSTPTETRFVSSTIKEVGDFTSTIGRSRPGDSALLEGPFGRFSYALYPGEQELIFIAGGVGVTPFISMLRHMRATSRDDLQVLLLYAKKTEDDIVFRDELAEIEAAGRPRLRVIHILSRPAESWPGERGHVDRDKVTRFCKELIGKSFYICGPPRMMSPVVEVLQNLGVETDSIHIERFSFV